MKLEKFYVVRNPTAHPTLVPEILKECTTVRDMVDQCYPSGVVDPTDDARWTIHTDLISATEDANFRLQIRDSVLETIGRKI